MRKLISSFVLLTLVALPPVAVALGLLDWNVDPAHTEVNFSVRHFFTPVSGSFTDYQVDLQFDPADPAASSVSAVIQVASIRTGVDARDQHLMSGDFFEAERYPQITFRSSGVRSVGEGQMIATGELTIKDTAQTVELPIRLLGIQPIPEEMQEMFGGVTRVASFQADLTLDRNDFGVGVGSWAETAIVGSEVGITLLVEANVR